MVSNISGIFHCTIQKIKPFGFFAWSFCVIEEQRKSSRAWSLVRRVSAFLSPSGFGTGSKRMESGGRREEQECAAVYSRCSEDVVEEASHGLDEEGCAERAGAKGGHAPPTTEARGLGADEPKEDGHPQSSLLAQVQKYQLRHRGCSAGAVGASEDSETGQ